MLHGTKVLTAVASTTERAILVRIARKLGCEVIAVGLASEAKEQIGQALAQGEPFDVILLDCRFPEQGGFRVIEDFETNPLVLERTVMLLTTDHRPRDVRKCRHYGLRDWLVKPARIESVLNALYQRGAEDHGSADHRSAAIEIEAPDSREARTLRILLTDDFADNRELILAYLRKTPHEIVTAEDGAEALEQFKQGRFDPVLMDMQMPVMDGYRATRLIREWESEQESNPARIIALTAHAFAEEVERMLAPGCDMHLSKPVRKARLVEVIEAFATEATGCDPQGPIHVTIDEDIAELIDGFLENRHVDVTRLHEAIESGNFDAVRVLGHNMKGSGRGCGFDGISEIGAQLELAGKHRKSVEACKCTDQLEDYLAQVVVG